MSEMSDYLLAEVKSGDQPRYLTALFAPHEVRSHLLALYAFNLEIAKTREAVSEPMIGEIRLQWWREALDGIAAGTPREHPVVLALRDIPNFTKIQSELLAVIDARVDDLYAEGPKNFGALKAYIEGAGGALGRAAAFILKPAARDDDLQVGAAAGRAYAMSGLLNGLGWAFSEGRQVLPEAELGAEGISPSLQLGPDQAQALKPVIQLMLDALEEDILAIRRSARSVRTGLVPLVLLAREAARTASRLKAYDLNPFLMSDHSESPVWIIARMMIGSMTAKP